MENKIFTLEELAEKDINIKDPGPVIKKALNLGKHVLCESPFALSEKDSIELQNLANENDLILMDSIKTFL